MNTASFALTALKANHEWHQEHDDYGGYPGSELEAQTLAAIAALECPAPTPLDRFAQIYEASCNQSLRPQDKTLAYSFARGLEAEYRAVPAPPAPVAWVRNDEATFTLLMLCGGHDVPREAVTAWTDEQCQQAENWASREHLHASDNDDVERVPMPEHVKAHPWKPADGVGDLWS